MNGVVHLLQALLLGGLLGVVYGFLRPLRPRWFADLLFVWALFAVWVQLVFGLCGGDLRFAYSATLLLGLGLWYMTLGQWLQPVFDFLWKQIFRIFSLIFFPVKKIWIKIRKIRNFLFATDKKWVTIKRNKHPPGADNNA